MPEVVVVINRMAVTKTPIKWQLVLELLHHLFSILLPSSHSLLEYIIHQNAATSSHHPYHIIELLQFTLILDKNMNCYLYGICISHLHLSKIILRLFTWDHGRPLSYLLYDSTGKNTLLTQPNQPFKDIETRINNYIPTSGK